MGQTEATRQSDNIKPPLTDNAGKPAYAVLATSSTAGVLDLRTLPALPVNSPVVQTSNQFEPPGSVLEQRGAAGHYITIFAGDSDLYVNFGQNLADVTTTNAPLATAVCTVNASGVLTTAIQAAWRIPAGTTQHFRLPRGPNRGAGSGTGFASANADVAEPARFMGFVNATGATGKMYVAVTSEGINQ